MNLASKTSVFVALSLYSFHFAQANVVLTTDPGAFLSANPIVSTETFDEFPTTEFTGQSVTIDGVTYSDPSLFPGWTVAPALSLSPTHLSGPNALFTQFSDQDKTITFGGGDVLAFGFTFIPFGSAPGANPEFDFEVEETDGSITNFLMSPTSPYIGFSSSLGIEAIDVDQVAVQGVVTNYAFDDVSRTAITPEPSDAGLVGSFLVLMSAITVRGESRRSRLQLQ